MPKKKKEKRKKEPLVLLKDPEIWPLKAPNVLGAAMQIE
jgi:hypothetical protein